jgi:hypothetical protein
VYSAEPRGYWLLSNILRDEIVGVPAAQQLPLACENDETVMGRDRQLREEKKGPQVRALIIFSPPMMLGGRSRS